MTHHESLVECKTAKITFRCISVLQLTEKDIGFEVRPSFETRSFEIESPVTLEKLLASLSLIC